MSSWPDTDASQYWVHSTHGLSVKQADSFSRSGQSGAQESAVCLGVAGQWPSGCTWRSLDLGREEGVCRGRGMGKMKSCWEI